MEDRAKQLPGPADYDLEKTGIGQGIATGRFNASKPKSDIEWKMYAASQIPGPLDTYSPYTVGADGRLSGCFS